MQACANTTNLDFVGERSFLIDNLKRQLLYVRAALDEKETEKGEREREQHVCLLKFLSLLERTKPGEA